jgi:hypothetical protein
VGGLCLKVCVCVREREMLKGLPICSVSIFLLCEIFAEVIALSYSYDQVTWNMPIFLQPRTYIRIFRFNDETLFFSLFTQEILQAERMMRSANEGSLEIAHLPPNPHPIPNTTGPLSDPQTDFFLNALGLSHIWTQPSGFYPPSNGSMIDAPDIEVFVDRCGSSSGDPNQLSISDDEEEDTEVMPARQPNPAAASSLASACTVDPSEIEFDDEVDWTCATETATAASVTAMKVQGPENRGQPGLPAGVILKKVAPRNDVISFDDEIQIVSDASKSSFGLTLPPAKGPSLPDQLGPKIP